MPRINLLPWRDLERRDRRLKFFVALGVAGVGAAVMALAAHIVLGTLIDAQERRNEHLRTEIKTVDKQIEQINDLEAQKQRFISRMQVIEKLQRSRPEVVHVFDELVKAVPGRHLPDVNQAIRRQAQAGGRGPVLDPRFDMMRNIVNSQWLRDPNLEVVETKKDAPGSSFVLDAKQISLATDDQDNAVKHSTHARRRELQMSLMQDIRSLDLRDPGRWPLPVLVLAVAVAFVVLSLVLVMLLVWNARMPVLDQRESEEKQLRTEFSTKHAKAANLSVYEQQLKDIEKSFGAMLRQLPSKTEVPNLLVDISQTGLAAALQEKLFQPGQETKHDFYAELPIKIRLTGSYHEFGEFVSGIAALPRIVTLHDIEITPQDKTGGFDQLQLDLTAKTYRYLDDEELAQAETEKRKADEAKKHAPGG